MKVLRPDLKGGSLKVEEGWFKLSLAKENRPPGLEEGAMAEPGTGQFY